MQKETAIKNAVEAIKASSKQSAVYIGCDSIVKKKKDPVSRRTIATAKYTTVIVLHIDGCHGGKIFHFSEFRPDYGDIFTRMMTECEIALEAFKPISDVIGDRVLEIHLDINKNKVHKSNVAAQAAIGWVTGQTGIKPKIKPEGWAATHAADHMVKR